MIKYRRIKGSFALGNHDNDKVDFSDFYDDIVMEWVQHPIHDDVVVLHFVVIAYCNSPIGIHATHS